MPIASSLLLFVTARIVATENPLDVIYACLIPRAACLSLLAVAVLLARTLVSTAARRHAKLQRFGRKSLLITSSSFLFVFSCLYRALNIADEGAFLCRGPASIYNMPAAGRAVATVGELALVVQISGYLADTARRLQVRRSLSIPYTLAPAIVAECCSWLGVVTGVSRFFCVEYLCWVGIAALWAWDAAELLHKSRSRVDALVHAVLVAASVGLVAFNFIHELPHFFTATPLNSHDETPARPTPFSCTQDAESPIWLSRLPFFVTYFVGASACSTMLAVHYHFGSGRLRGVRSSLRFARS